MFTKPLQLLLNTQVLLYVVEKCKSPPLFTIAGLSPKPL
jgi:hypothetical protein